MTSPLDKWLEQIEKRIECVEPVKKESLPVFNIRDDSKLINEYLSFGLHSRTDLPLLVKLLRKAIEQRDWHIANYCCDWGEHKEITTENNKEFTAIISDTLGADNG